jgi:hypothetical protein
MLRKCFGRISRKSGVNTETVRTGIKFKFHNCINNIHNCLQLNPNNENNTQINFLDLCIIRKAKWKLTSTENPLPLTKIKTNTVRAPDDERCAAQNMLSL